MSASSGGSVVVASWSRAPTGLDDPEWSGSPGVDLINAREDSPVVFGTRLQLVDDHETLWARYQCRARQVTATMTRHKDKVWTEGAVELFLKRPGAPVLYEFQLSPIATRRDLIVHDPGGPMQRYDDSWNCAGFTGAASITRDDRGNVVGWDALIGVTWASVGGSPGTDHPGDWLIGAFRWEYHPLEFSGFASHPDREAHDEHFLRALRRSFHRDDGTASDLTCAK